MIWRWRKILNFCTTQETTLLLRGCVSQVLKCQLSPSGGWKLISQQTVFSASNKFQKKLLRGIPLLETRPGTISSSSLKAHQSQSSIFVDCQTVGIHVKQTHFIFKGINENLQDGIALNLHRDLSTLFSYIHYNVFVLLDVDIDRDFHLHHNPLVLFVSLSFLLADANKVKDQCYFVGGNCAIEDPILRIMWVNIGCLRI